MDDTGKITGYKTSVGGADTVFPFSTEIVGEYFFSGNGISYMEIPVNTYKNVSLKSSYLKVNFKYFDGTYSDPLPGGSNEYINYSIPDNAIMIKLSIAYGGVGGTKGYYHIY